MTHKINKAKELVEQNQSEECYPTFVYSVLDNFINGQVFIDDRTAFIGTNAGIYVVSGDPKNQGFFGFLTQIFESRKNDNKRFTLFSPSEEWDEVIKMLFEEELREIRRYSFHFNKSKFSRVLQGEVPDEFKVRKIDEEIIKYSQDFSETYLNEYWDSVTNFFAKGFGYCLTDSNTIASECISIFSSSEFAEMDIVTQNEYRGMGLAKKVAERFILHCIEVKKKPRWDCDIYNTASIKLADKLGFESPKEYSVFTRK